MSSSAAKRIWLVAGITLREAARRKVVLAVLLMSLGFLALYGVALHVGESALWGSNQVGLGELERHLIASELLYMGLFPTSFLVALTAVFASAGTLSSELDSGVIYGVLALPVRRAELVVGKFLGLATMLAVYSVAFNGGMIALARWQVGAPILATWPVALALLVFESIPLLALSMLGTSRLPTLANGVLCTAAYGVAFIGGIIETIGALLKDATMGNIGIITSLVMPLDALHHKAMLLLLPEGLLLQNGGPLGIGGGTTPSNTMVVYAALYVVALVALAARVFTRRDL